MKCPICNLNVRVRKDGKFSNHRNSQPSKYWSYWCPTSNQSAQHRLHQTAGGRGSKKSKLVVPAAGKA